MEMRVGDKVKFKAYKGTAQDIEYTVLEIYDGCVKVKHPSVGGYFIFRIESVSDIIQKQDSENGYNKWNTE